MDSRCDIAARQCASSQIHTPKKVQADNMECVFGRRTTSPTSQIRHRPSNYFLLRHFEETFARRSIFK